ncbi:GH116 family glycosyl-hydrolase [Armatimonas rosea]|uniref:Uncharacterized protein (DUF608 family) n=1 Tax=Armatimonas rosea TaxID=685828 RepID=A0A7W9W967_ARMRO|nr:GH116 family glycosyl-hydrolase [Armatimonas rosea]MBB6052875.1 uncharacterized protein (DUF608 family) [Armatimonas rosea]
MTDTPLPHPIPAEKNLSPVWLQSLTARGEPTVYDKSKGELRYIGMPVGGIACGLLYLGGDGKLWLWDIFNLPKEGVIPRSVEVPMAVWLGSSTFQARDGGGYVVPYAQESPLQQGFVLRVVDGVERSLDQHGWSDVSFQGQYPVGTVRYTDPACPVQVQLEAFSPFIPLNLDDSSLPATVLRFTLTNTSAASVEATLVGFLENAVGHYTAPAGRRRNTAEGELLVCRLESPTDPTAHDIGTLALACLGATRATAQVDTPGATRPVGALERTLTLAPGSSETVTFILAWHFPNNLHLPVPDAKTGNHYATRFADAAAVVGYVKENLERLSHDTLLWRDTWYDSTLPYWFLDRALASASTLATTTLFRLGTGRFWAWEGIGCCPGTCTHVWHYAQAPGRLFPELERELREQVDFGVGFDPETGMVRHRAEGSAPAIDGQCGRILGVLREHQMSPDSAFLTRLWPRVRRALEYLMAHDTDQDGLLDGAQENTLDAAWYGKIAWLSSLYAAALRAGEALATEQGEPDFAALCAARAAQTQAALEGELFNGEYFIQKPEPGREGALGTYSTCHIDQVHGQSWAWQVGLGRVLDREKTVTALRALYKYNFAPDIGPFRQRNRAGRPYALPGEAGLIMATNPGNVDGAFGNVSDWQYGYFNECMSGFEHQAASHMIAEGLVTEGLTVTRAIHERYHAKRRNPYNEVECSDHYARAMASYGSFIALCGFAYHGPDGTLSLDPRLPGDFRVPFTSAEGWGTLESKAGVSTLSLRWGRLRLTALTVRGHRTTFSPPLLLTPGTSYSIPDNTAH